MAHTWKANPAAFFDHRLGKSAKELGISKKEEECPDIWQLDNGDIAVIGTDLTGAYVGRLPGDVTLASHERLVVIPGKLFSAARGDRPDA